MWGHLSVVIIGDVLSMSTDTDSEDIEFDTLSMTEKRPLVPEPKPKRSSNVQNVDAPGQVQRTPQFVYTLSFFAAIGGFLFGYDTGVVSGAMLLLQPEFELDSVWEEMVVSATILFAAIFALVGGPLNDKIGRKAVTVLASLVFTGGAVLLGVAQNKVMLLAGRSILGVGIGKLSILVVNISKRMRSILVVGISKCMRSILGVEISKCMRSILWVGISKCLRSILVVGISKCMRSILVVGISKCMRSILVVNISKCRRSILGVG